MTEAQTTHADGALEELFQRGLGHYRRGEFAQAAADFTAALKLDPDNAVLYAHRGDACRLQCEYERAIGDVLVNRAGAYHLSGEHRLAVADCDAALELDANNSAAFRARAAALAAL